MLFTLILLGADPDFKPDQSKLPVPAPKGATVLLDDNGKHEFLSMAGEKINRPIEEGVIVSDTARDYIRDYQIGEFPILWG